MNSLFLTFRGAYLPRRQELLFLSGLISLWGLIGCESAPAPTAIMPAVDRRGNPVKSQLYGELRAINPSAIPNDPSPRSSDPDESQLNRNVQIVGQDILLPQKETDSIPDGTQYSFYVFAHDPKGKRSIDELLNTGELRIEVLGAKPTTLLFPTVSAIAPKLRDEILQTDARVSINHSVAQLVFSPGNDKNPLRPFTILAWFPGRFTNQSSDSLPRARDDGAKRDPWSDRRDVRVYYGDIKTRVQILSQTEAAALFGRTFAQNYYVGSVNLTNRSDTKSLAVNTTSMRVPVLFYRKSLIAGELDPAAAAALDRQARLAHSSGQRSLAEAKGVVTATEKELGHRIRYTQPPLIIDDRSRSSSARTKAPPNPPHEELVQRVLALWAYLDNKPRADPNRLSSRQVDTLLARASVIPLPESEPLTAGKRDEVTNEVLKEVLSGDKSLDRAAEARTLVQTTLWLLANAQADARREASDLKLRLANLRNSLPASAQSSEIAPATAAEFERYKDLRKSFDTLGIAADAPAIAQEVAEVETEIAKISDPTIRTTAKRILADLTPLMVEWVNRDKADEKNADRLELAIGAQRARLPGFPPPSEGASTVIVEDYVKYRNLRKKFADLVATATSSHLMQKWADLAKEVEALDASNPAAKTAFSRALNEIGRAKSDAFINPPRNPSSFEFQLATTLARLPGAPIAPIAPATTPPKVADPARYRELLTAFDSFVASNSLAVVAEERDKFIKKIAEVVEEGAAEVFVRKLDTATSLMVDHLKRTALAEALAGRPVQPDLRAHVELVRDSIRQEARAKTGRGTPFNEAPIIPVNPSDFPLAFSGDSYRQMRLLESGYIWRDYYRPLTFTTVLQAVMTSHDNDPTVRRLRTMETLARIAGGAIGMSEVFNEVGRTSYLQATNFFSSIFVPSLKSLLEEDVTKAIKRVGETGMGQVVIIPPHDFVDRFIFFPRGPIYNFPDEFDPTSPGYIAGVEGTELFVEALPINPNEVVRGGSVDAVTQGLAQQALNEGEVTAQGRLFEIAQSQAKVRTSALANLLHQIEAMMAAVPGDDPKRLKITRSEVQRLVNQYHAYFGPDQSGTLAAALAKFNIVANDSPPTIVVSDTLELPAGSISTPIRLSISDQETPLKDLEVALGAKTKETEAEWLFDAPSTSAVSGITVVVDTKANPALKEPARHKIDYTVKDQAGHVIPFSLPVVVQPWAVTFTLHNDKEVTTTAIPDASQFALTDEQALERQNYRITLAAPIKDADGTKVEYKLVSQKVGATDVTIGTLGATKRGASPATLTADFSFDTSAITEATAVNYSFTLAVVRGETTLYSVDFGPKVKSRTP